MFVTSNEGTGIKMFGIVVNNIDIHCRRSVHHITP